MKPDGKAEPRFDIDVAYGRQGELLIADYLTWLAEGNGRIEVKRKSYLDLNFYVETHCDKGRTGVYVASGISITTAHTWAFVIHDTEIAILIPTEELRGMLDDGSTKDREQRDGAYPTKGKLVSLNVLLYRRKRALEQKAPRPSVPTSVEQPALQAKDIRWAIGK